MMRAIAIVSLIACTAGCGLGGSADFRAKLAGEYSIYRSSSHQISITPEGWSDDTPIIPTKVIECAVDRHFILAKRQGLKRRNPNDPNDTYEEPDPNVFDYWILDTVAPKVYGPLDTAQYKSMRQELGVTESTELKDVYSFRP